MSISENIASIRLKIEAAAAKTGRNTRCKSKKALIQNLPILYQSLFQLVLYTQVTLFWIRSAFSRVCSTQ